MEWPKLKNIIILILLLANLFLLVMVGVQERGTAQYQEQALADALTVLERNGITLDREAVPEELDITSLTVERDQKGEAALAAALLGECTAADLGSGRYEYRSGLGWAEFRSNGSFSFTFEGAAQPVQPGAEEDHALTAMKKLGFNGMIIDRGQENDRLSLTLRQTWKGLSVYSCQVTLVYAGGCLRSITGQRLMGEPQSAGDGSAPITAPTALLRLLNGISDLGDICSEITAMTPGYLLTQNAEAAQLIPMWYVTTDTGAYSLNALTGALERA